MQLAGQEVSSSPRAPAVASLSFGPASGAPISLEHDLGHSEVVLADPTAIIPPPGNIARSRQAATRAYAALSGPRGPVYIGLLAVLISLPALRLGLMSDDHILAWQLEHGARPWALFEVAEERVSELREAGGIAWWASPRLSVAFLRPLASLTHALDFTAWPHTPWLMSLWNVLLYGLCAFVAALLYRRTAPSPSVASLAALLFALNEAHAMSVGWISGRNTVLALLGSLTALYCHLRARGAPAWLRRARDPGRRLCAPFRRSGHVDVWPLARLRPGPIPACPNACALPFPRPSSRTSVHG